MQKNLEKTPIPLELILKMPIIAMDAKLPGERGVLSPSPVVCFDIGGVRSQEDVYYCKFPRDGLKCNSK